jgi:hypothetical protein
MTLVQQWFDYDLSQYNFFLMPMSFHHQSDIVESFSVSPPNKQMRNMLSYLSLVEDRFPSNEDKEFNITLRIDTRFVKATTDAAMKVQYSNDPNAPKVTITEEEALRKYPLDYRGLMEKLRKRYTDLVQNGRFNKIKSELEKNEKLCRVRLLNPNDPGGSKKKFYSISILKEFDKHYEQT